MPNSAKGILPLMIVGKMSGPGKVSAPCSFDSLHVKNCVHQCARNFIFHLLHQE